MLRKCGNFKNRMGGIPEHRNISSPPGLLEAIQRRVPLVPRPYEQLAGELNCRRGDVIGAVERLRRGGVIREISGIFDAAAMGYSQTLAAFAIADDRLDNAGEIVSRHPGVSHCYGRSGDFNLWFTLAVSPLSNLGADGTISALADMCGARSAINLPTLKRYKLDVQFGPSRGAPTPSGTRPDSRSAAEPTGRQVRAIGAFQEDLPAREAPFDEIAGRFGFDTHTLLVHGADFLAAGWMRRYAAVLHHRAAGATANVMVAWRVGDELADAAGAACTRFDEVSHCYLRATARDWPWNLYTMIHGTDREQCESTIAHIADATGLDDYRELWTTGEYKKRRIRLFGNDEQVWESNYLR